MCLISVWCSVISRRCCLCAVALYSTLDVSGNRLEGHLPDWLSTLTALSYVMLMQEVFSARDTITIPLRPRWW